MLNLQYVPIESKNEESVELRLIRLPAGFGCDVFYMSETPITEAQWCAIMKGIPNNPEHPKVNVNYDEVQEFCDKASRSVGATFRLPTAFEWCRAVGTEPSSEDLEKYAVFGRDTICSVKTKLPNEYGLYDMRGLVYEWQHKLTDKYQTVRGGSWSLNASYCRSAFRLVIHPGVDLYDFGFRVVVSAMH